MTVIATFTFICDICEQMQAYAERTDEHSEIDVRFDQMVEGWATVWIDENNLDTVCGICMDTYSDQITFDTFGIGSYHWINRPQVTK